MHRPSSRWFVTTLGSTLQSSNQNIKCANPEADCDSTNKTETHSYPWQSLDGSQWDLDKLVYHNRATQRRRSGKWRDQHTINRCRMRQSDQDHCGWCLEKFGKVGTRSAQRSRYPKLNMALCDRCDSRYRNQGYLAPKPGVHFDHDMACDKCGVTESHVWNSPRAIRMSYSASTASDSTLRPTSAAGSTG
jgi:hypothetical protein